MPNKRHRRTGRMDRCFSCADGNSTSVYVNILCLCVWSILTECWVDVLWCTCSFSPFYNFVLSSVEDADVAVVSSSVASRSWSHFWSRSKRSDHRRSRRLPLPDPLSSLCCLSSALVSVWNLFRSIFALQSSWLCKLSVLCCNISLCFWNRKEEEKTLQNFSFSKQCFIFVQTDNSLMFLW